MVNEFDNAEFNVIMGGYIWVQFTIASLPFHHRDPFDRLLIAQVVVEQIPLVSSDKAPDTYGIHRLW